MTNYKNKTKILYMLLQLYTGDHGELCVGMGDGVIVGECGGVITGCGVLVVKKMMTTFGWLCLVLGLELWLVVTLMVLVLSIGLHSSLENFPSMKLKPRMHTKLIPNPKPKTVWHLWCNPTHTTVEFRHPFSDTSFIARITSRRTHHDFVTILRIRTVWIKKPFRIVDCLPDHDPEDLQHTVNCEHLPFKRNARQPRRKKRIRRQVLTDKQRATFNREYYERNQGPTAPSQRRPPTPPTPWSRSPTILGH